MPKTLRVHGERGARWSIVPVGLAPAEWDSTVDVGASHPWGASVMVAWWVLWPRACGMVAKWALGPRTNRTGWGHGERYKSK